MVEISEQMECLFTGTIEQHGESYRIEIPQNELQNGLIVSGETYRIAILSTETSDRESDSRPQSPSSNPEMTTQSPPAETGETRIVSIESIGDQGDGIAKVERGYVVIIPGARPSDGEVEVQNVRENLAFAASDSPNRLRLLEVAT